MAASYSKRDVSRYSKTYAYVRQAPRFEYQIPESKVHRADADSKTFEFATLSFEGGNRVHFDFQKKYTSVPAVFASPSDENMSVFVESVDLSSAVIRSSVNNVGFANVHVLANISGSDIDTTALSIARKIDKTRFTKDYNYIRKSEGFSYEVSTSEITGLFIDVPDDERTVIRFDGSGTIAYTFQRSFGAAPYVIATPLDGINVFIDSVSTTQVVIGNSSETGGSVAIRLIDWGSLVYTDRTLIDGTCVEYNTSQTDGNGQVTVTLAADHSTIPTIVLTASGSDANVNVVSATKDVFMVESSIPDVKFHYYAVSKP